MKRETKFNYGLLLVSLGVPFIADYFLGRKCAVIAAIVITVAGFFFLLSGHQHREKDEPATPRGRFRRAIILAIASAVCGAGAIGIATVLRKNEPPIRPTALFGQLRGTLKQRMSRLSADLIGFLADREAKSPKVSPSGADAMQKADELIKYDEETSRIYAKEYMPKVFAVYRELQSRAMDDQMLAAMLGMRASPATIRKIADRLEMLAATIPDPN
jgi:hypothetical protein